tara:strand:- start:61 stop:966 length:906 start_codon:yes stop_codon:yes gene_type:complete
MIKIYFPINSQNIHEKNEIFEILLSGFYENPSVSIVNNIESCDYILLHHSYFKLSNKILYPEKTIIVDMSDSFPKNTLLTDVKCLLYFKRSCIDKKLYKFREYKNPIIPISFPIKKSYIDYLKNEKINIVNINRQIDVCCTHLDTSYAGVNNFNVFRTNIVKYLVNLQQQTEYKFHLGYDKTNIPQARGGLNNQYFNTLLNSKIIITCNPDWWDGDYRLWESLASGALVFCDKMLTPVVNPFEHKKHLIYYDRENIDELSLLIEYYLKNDDERKQIALEGYNYAMKYHKYSDRAKEILNHL